MKIADLVTHWFHTAGKRNQSITKFMSDNVLLTSEDTANHIACHVEHKIGYILIKDNIVCAD